MPRKKVVIDPIEQVRGYFDTVSLETAQVVLAIIASDLRKRVSSGTLSGVAKIAKRAEEKPQTNPAPEIPATPAAASAPKPKRMRANSPRPANEAAPIVPLQSTVGEVDGDTNDNVN